MRIVGGDFKGSHIISPKSGQIRPTADRVRESLFNVLTHLDGFRFHGITAADLFCGTGALGIEALSRGAERCFFIDRNKASLDLCRDNVQKIVRNKTTVLLQKDAQAASGDPRLPHQGLDLVFLDPPYGKDMGTAALNALARHDRLKNEALCVIEMAEKSPEPVPDTALFDEVFARRYGTTIIKIYRYVSSENKPLQTRFQL